MIQYTNKKAYNQIWSPMGRYPMIDNTIFETYDEALTFATTNAVAVVGNIITVINDSTSDKNGVYLLIYTGETPLSASSQPTGIKKIESNLSGYATESYVNSEISTLINNKLSSVYKFKGSKSSYDLLPTIDVNSGDVYNIESEFTINNITYPKGTNVAWAPAPTPGEPGHWDPLGGTSDVLNWIEIQDTNENLIGD